MTKHTYVTGLIFIVASVALQWSSHAKAAASGDLGLSVSVIERYRIDFSEGSADYFQSCSSAEVKASGTASNVLGELTAVAATADPYYLDRDLGAQGFSNDVQNTLASNNSTDLNDRRRRAPKVVTINY